MLMDDFEGPELVPLLGAVGAFTIEIKMPPSTTAPISHVAMLVGFLGGFGLNFFAPHCGQAVA